MGRDAGRSNQGLNAIAIGYNAGNCNQSTNSIAIALSAGSINQGSNTIAIGCNAGSNSQNSGAISLGGSAGRTGQGTNAIAIGMFSGCNSQGSNAISIGLIAGTSNQSTNAIAIGVNAGSNNQSNSAIAIGTNAGLSGEGVNSVAIGCNAGRSNMGSNAIAIGALAGQTNQHSRSIILNASVTDLSSFNTDALYINPIRNSTGTSNQFNSLYYNTFNKEVSYLPNEYVNVKSYGAIGDGITDDTTAIQNAINANPGKCIFFPQGTYDISGTITITANNTILVGTGFSTSVISQNANNTTAIHFVPALITTLLNAGCGIMDLQIQFTTPSGQTSATNSLVWVQRQSKFLISNVSIVNTVVGLKISGCTTSFFNFLTFNDSTSQPFVSGSCCIYFENSVYFTGSTYKDTIGGVLQFTNCNLVGARLGTGLSAPYHTKEYATINTFNDGTRFLNTYFGNCDNHILVDVNKLTDPSGNDINDDVAYLSFGECYFDSAGVNLDWNAARCLTIKATNPLASIGDIHFTNCYFNVDRNVVYIENVTTTQPRLLFNNCQLNYFNRRNPIVRRYNDFCFIKANNVNGTSIQCVNNFFRADNAITSSGGYLIDISSGNLSNITLTGNQIRASAVADSSACSLIYYNGTLRTMNLANNSHTDFTGFIQDISYNTGSSVVEFSSVGNTSLSTVSSGRWDQITTPNTNIAIGNTAGCNAQGSNCISIGSNAGFIGQTSNAIAIGSNAGSNSQNSGAIAIGGSAGRSAQGTQAIAIGMFSGSSTQGSGAISIGISSGSSNQGINAIAIGASSGNTNQGSNAIAIGAQAGRTNQASGAIAIGFQAGTSGQGSNAIAIGSNAGRTGQSNNCIAIGALAGQTGQLNNTIIINALGTDVSSIDANACYIAPIRNATFTNSLGYDVNSREVVYSSKTFVIDHPTDKNKYLQHACLEGAEAGVYYRGQSIITNKEFVLVKLPEYVNKIATELTVYATRIYDGKLRHCGVSQVFNNSFMIYSDDNGEFNWVVYGKRLNIEVEPSKEEYELKGDGPYTYLVKK